MREWFHFHACVISRSRGQSAVAAAAYRSGSRLYSRADGLTKDFSERADRDEIAHTEILAPDGSPEWVYDREELWNRAEDAETRQDAQLAREVRFALAREFTPEERIEVARSYIREHFTADGMIADLAIHHDAANHNPHVHIMLTTRRLDGDVFGGKAREWNNKARLKAWRAGCSTAQNRVLERKRVDVRADHRSYKDRGIELEPGFHVGPGGWAVGERLHREGRHGKARNLLRPHRGDYGRQPPQVRKPAPAPQASLFGEPPKRPRRGGLARGQVIVSGIMWGGARARQGRTRAYSEREGLRYIAQRQRKAERIKKARSVSREQGTKDRFDRLFKLPCEARLKFTRYAAEKGLRAAFVRLNREPERYGPLLRSRRPSLGGGRRNMLAPNVPGRGDRQRIFPRAGPTRDNEKQRPRDR